MCACVCVCVCEGVQARCSPGCLWPWLQPLQQAIESGCTRYYGASTAITPLILFQPECNREWWYGWPGGNAAASTLVKETDEYHSKLRHTHFGLRNSAGILLLLSWAAAGKTAGMHIQLGYMCPKRHVWTVCTLCTSLHGNQFSCQLQYFVSTSWRESDSRRKLFQKE